ncbi:unnamed protein product [Rhodiola kirilowii]
MSFVFRGTRSDIESGFPGSGYMAERPAMRIHAARPVNTNSLAFLITVLLLFTVLNSRQMSPNFLQFCGKKGEDQRCKPKMWLVVGAFLMATSLRMYATCQQLQVQAPAHAATASGLLGHTELRLQMPPAIAFTTRGQLQGLRLQLALLDREFDDMDYETLRALDIDNASGTPSMSEEEINELPVHNYTIPGTKSEPLLQQQGSSSVNIEGKQDAKKSNSNMKAAGDELTCTVCLEQVNPGELVRTLPCLHQFHVNCIDPWLRQQGTCPICKFRVSSGWQEGRGSGSDAADMV